ncbi:hypothetical protein NPIL_680211 [Nephila pilipes]|uniref:Uncharacterized protein n=1 Tax=Nephila pilipes TaxID=299642 RepID=A0A8X6IV27_NEPPI|nr:hypothetical protein NPIL_680211 [Nephila pilipes]
MPEKVSHGGRSTHIEPDRIQSHGTKRINMDLKIVEECKRRRTRVHPGPAPYTFSYIHRFHLQLSPTTPNPYKLHSRLRPETPSRSSFDNKKSHQQAALYPRFPDRFKRKIYRTP